MSHNNPLPETHVLLTIVLVGDETAADNRQRALVRRELTVSDLLARTLRTFGKEKELDLNSTYSFSLITDNDTRVPLDDAQTIEAANVVNGSVLIMGYSAAQRRSELLQDTATGVEQQRQRLILYARPIRDTRGGTEPTTRGTSQEMTRYRLSSRDFPAIIGRRPYNKAYANPTIDLTTFEESGDRRISRAHAQLISDGGAFYIEALSDALITIGDRALGRGARHRLRNGELLVLGKAVELRVEISSD